MRAFLITMSALAPLIVAGPAAAADDLATRHGRLTIDARNELRFRGESLSPRVAAANGLDFVRKFASGGEDIVLLRSRGGTACPMQYWLVTVASTGTVATEAFGTCAELRELRQTASGIEMSMPDFRGPHDPASARMAAAKRIVRFTFAQGRLTRTP
jgi:hypothetical protein